MSGAGTEPTVDTLNDIPMETLTAVYQSLMGVLDADLPSGWEETRAFLRRLRALPVEQRMEAMGMERAGLVKWDPQHDGTGPEPKWQWCYVDTSGTDTLGIPESLASGHLGPETSTS